MRTTLRCIECGQVYREKETRYSCDCGGLLDVIHDFQALPPEKGRLLPALFDDRLSHRFGPSSSGVWRFRELVLEVEDDQIVSCPEGNTPLYTSPALSRWTGIEDLACKHEGENPTGSFKDRGMTVGVTQARRLNAQAVACASTGNTSASLASYAARAGLQALVFIPEGGIAYGKLSQALAYGATAFQVKGDFDTAMRLVQEVSHAMGIYLLNSINPFRVEGQKTILFEALQQRGWVAPDWFVFPAGNLGNTSAFGKALLELRQLGILSRLPRLAAVQAQGANPFYLSFQGGFQERFRVVPKTLATAICIGDPVSFARAVRAIRETDGRVLEVTDQEILDAKAMVDQAGIGCEPASAASLAGARKLRQEGTIRSGESVVAILTGHLLKDPGTTVDYHLSRQEGIRPAFANPPQTVEANLEAVRLALERIIPA
jgi:threonine synthase